MLDITKGDFQTYSLSWVGLNSPDIFRQIFHSGATPPAGKNRGRYQSIIADSYIEAGEKASSVSDRKSIYENLELHLLKELPYFPLWYEDQLAVWSNSITGYKVDSTGSYYGLLEVKKI
jgi:peptide/nickel transport system substrate-binding protein